MVLAYEDFQAGVHGFHICRDLFEAVDQELGFGFRNAWRFDFLRNSRLREKAISETICADMVVISAHAAGGLPPAAKWWLETALEQREGDPGALVLLLDAIPEGTETLGLPIESYLAECAQNGGMEWFIKRAATRSRPGHSGAGRPGNEINLPELHNGLKMTTDRNVAAVKEEPVRLPAGFEPCPRRLRRSHFRFSSARMELGKVAGGIAKHTGRTWSSGPAR